jgi:hypothetical protein
VSDETVLDIPPTAEVVDFFSFSETTEYELRDTGQYVTIKRMTEGDRRKYLNATSREINFDGAGHTSMNLKPGDDRRALLEVALVDWSLLRNGKPIPFNTGNLRQFLDSADPALVDAIDKAVRDYNPWLMADVTLEDIDEQIADLEDLRRKKLAELEGNGD